MKYLKLFEDLDSKTCIKCGLDKPLVDFGRDKRKIDLLSNVCKNCNNLRYRRYLRENPDAKKETSSKYYLNNKDRLNKKSKEWLVNNKEKFREYFNEYRRNKRKSDELFSIKERLRKLVSNSFTRNRFSKVKNTEDIIGCTFEEFLAYIESKFEPWMTWENRGKYNGEFNYGWDIDHIVPISSAKTEHDLVKLNHYTNLQPLCSKVNRDIKGNKQT